MLCPRPNKLVLYFCLILLVLFFVAAVVSHAEPIPVLLNGTVPGYFVGVEEFQMILLRISFGDQCGQSFNILSENYDILFEDNVRLGKKVARKDRVLLVAGVIIAIAIPVAVYRGSRHAVVQADKK